MSDPPGEWVYVYDPALGTLPTAQGWTEVAEVDSTVSIIADQLVVDLPAEGDTNVWYYFYEAVAANACVVSLVDFDADDACVLYLINGTDWITLLIYGDQIYDQNVGTIYTADMTGNHTVRIEKIGPNYDLFVDDVAVVTSQPVAFNFDAGNIMQCYFETYSGAARTITLDYFAAQHGSSGGVGMQDWSVGSVTWPLPDSGGGG